MKWGYRSKREVPSYHTPEGYRCPECGELCKIIPLRSEYDYAGTHCTYGLPGTHYPDDWGDPVCDQCGALIEGE